MFGRHKAIERFTILFLGLTLCMGVLMTTIVIRKNAYDATRMSTQAIYTTSVNTSRSHVQGQVVDVMVSDDLTKAFVLWKMNDMQSLSSNADDYIMFLTGSTESQRPMTLKSQPSGGIYVFGISGYMGAYLVNNEPFESQILNLVVRNKKDFSSQEINGEANVAEVPHGGDNSFKTYDQLQIYFNPGAKNATHASFLDADTVDVKVMYEEAIVQAQKKQIRKSLQSDLQSMWELQRDMAKIEDELTNAKNGVYGMVLAPIERPTIMQTDVIQAYSYEGDKPLVWSEVDNRWMDEESGDLYNNGDYYLDLKTDYIFPGGYDYKWQKDVSGGYLKDLRGTATTTEYLKQQQTAYSKANDDGQLSLQVDSQAFRYSDGSQFVPVQNGDDVQLIKMSQAVQGLTDKWREYFRLRLKFQTQDLKNLLYAERDADMVGSTYSENFAERVLILY